MNRRKTLQILGASSVISLSGCTTTLMPETRREPQGNDGSSNEQQENSNSEVTMVTDQTPTTPVETVEQYITALQNADTEAQNELSVEQTIYEEPVNIELLSTEEWTQEELVEWLNGHEIYPRDEEYTVDTYQSEFTPISDITGFSDSAIIAAKVRKTGETPMDYLQNVYAEPYIPFRVVQTADSVNGEKRWIIQISTTVVLI